jgi:hypothetical protein
VGEGLDGAAPEFLPFSELWSAALWGFLGWTVRSRCRLVVAAGSIGIDEARLKNRLSKQLPPVTHHRSGFCAAAGPDNPIIIVERASPAYTDVCTSTPPKVGA